MRGFNVLTNINNTPTDANSRPLADVIITRTSFVPDNFDTVLTLAGTNSVGVAGTISVVADDGAGGRATNTFTATTVTDTQNDPPFLYPATVTNLVAPVNGRLTNIISALDLETNTLYLEHPVFGSKFVPERLQLAPSTRPMANCKSSSSRHELCLAR